MRLVLRSLALPLLILLLGTAQPLGFANTLTRFMRRWRRMNRVTIPALQLSAPGDACMGSYF
jgi:hypothetical protein